MKIPLRPPDPRRRRARRDDESGMTLFEIAVSMVILAIGASATLVTMTTTSGVDSSVNERAVALRAAHSQMERVRSFDYGSDIQNFIDYWSDPNRSTFAVDELRSPDPDAVTKVLAGGESINLASPSHNSTNLAAVTESSPAPGVILLDTSDPLRVKVEVTVVWRTRSGYESLSLPMTLTEIEP
jgi:prepilin-type N-terminal cleavage/methylation domain-containing protein